METAEMKSWLDKQFAGMSLESKTMFGNPSWLVNGNMFAKIEKGKFVVRMDPKDRDEMIAKVAKVEKYVMFNGMQTKDYAAFAAADAAAVPYLKKGYEYTKKLPAKEKK